MYLVINQIFKFFFYFSGQPCTITHYEKASLKAVFTAVNSDMQNILVTEFETPIAKYDSAMLRATDIISIKFDELYS